MCGWRETAAIPKQKWEEQYGHGGHEADGHEESAPTAPEDHPGLAHAGDSNTLKQTQMCNVILIETSSLSKKSEQAGVPQSRQH